ncbi:MAG: hypothetical protein LBR82_03325 [Desulfovibrio sp.]|jgi:CheY-like chemotaxis protein|nr:hypothetical protein [Desulfovibrio sp.]
MSIPSTAFRKASAQSPARAAAALARAAATLAAAALLLVFTSAAASAADILAADKLTAPEALLPYLSWLADPQGEIGVRDLSAGAVQERFTPLYKGIPLKNKGPVWFRLVTVNSRRGDAGAVPAQDGIRLSMNLGQLPPGGARLFYSESPGPVSAPGVWHSETVDSREETLLPEAGLTPLSIYIRMEEMPGLWFSPMIGPQSAARAGLLPLDLLLPGITAAAAVACLLRLAADRALWALWAALYLVCVLGQSSLPLPSTDRGFVPMNLPALLAPGLTLMILPHVGRCMFRTDKASALKGGTLYFCSLLGAMTAMLPLVPGFSWLTRLFPLSPLLLAPALPFCLSSMAAKKPGALAFSGAVIMPVLGALLCLAALKYPDLHPAAARGGLWGLAVGGLGLALARVPRNVPGPGTGDEDKEGPAVPDTPGGLSAAFSVLSPQSQYEELPPLAVTHIGGAGDAEPAGTPRAGAGREDGQQGGDTSAGDKAGLLRTPGERPEKAHDISFFLPSGEDRSYLDLPSEVMNILEGPVPTDAAQPGSYPFNLHTLVRQVHDIVSPLAESKGLIFSWYMSPSLPVLLEGDSPRLRGALILLLQSAVQAADGGAVQLAVRRNPMTSFEGDLLFSISDNGSAQRTDAGFFLAWELASRTGGAFSVDYSATGGTRTAFNVRFKLLGAETALDPAVSALASPGGPESAAPPPRIGGARSLCILPAEMTGGARRHIARCLEGVPHTAVNAFDEEQLLRLAGEHEPDLVIFDADMPENVITRCLAGLRADEGAKGRKRAAVLVLTGHDMQAARLLEAGAGYVLGKPFTREAFLDAVVAAVPSAAPRLRASAEASAERPGMSAQPARGRVPGVSGAGPAGSPVVSGAGEDATWETFVPLHEVSAQHADADPDTAAGTPVAANGARPLPAAPDRSGQSHAETGADDDHAAKLPRPARLIPRGMTPDAPPFGEPATEAAPAAAPASAAGTVPASAPEPAPWSAAGPAPSSVPGSASAAGVKSEAASDEAEESEAKALPRPARLIPRGMAAEKPEGGSGPEVSSPAGPSASDEPDSALMPGQRLSRDPFLDPSVAFLRPTFTPPGRPPLREAVKLATGLEVSGAVSDAPEAPANAAGHAAVPPPPAGEVPAPSVTPPRPAGEVPAPPVTPAEDGNSTSRTAPVARETPGDTGGGRRIPSARQGRSGQSPGVPLRGREQSGGTVVGQAAQQAQAGPRTGVHLQVRAQPDAADPPTSSAGKGDDASGTARQVSGIAGEDRARAGGSAAELYRQQQADLGEDRARAGGSARAVHHAAERPGAVQVQLPPRHGIPHKGEADAGAAEKAAPKVPQPTGSPHGMQVSVHPSRNSAGGTSSPQPSPPPLSVRSAQGNSGQNAGASSTQSFQVRTAPAATTEVRSPQGESSRGRAARAEAGQATAGHAAAARVGTASVAVAQVGTAPAETGPVRVARTEAAPPEAGSLEAAHPKAGSPKAGSLEAGSLEAAPPEAGQFEAPRGEEQAPIENALSGMNGEVTPDAVGRAASDAAPMVMGLSPEDVVAPATAPAAAPYRRAETGKRGRHDEEHPIDPGAVRAPDRAEDGIQAGAGRGREEEKRTLPGSLIDFMLLDSAQEETDTGAANGTEKTGLPRPASGKSGRDAGGPAVAGSRKPPQAENNAAGQATREPGRPARPVSKADAARSKAIRAAAQPSAESPVALQPDPKAPITNLPVSLPVPLPGLDGEFLDPDALPLLPGLTGALADALQDAEKGRDEKRLALVQEAAARMASRAEHFGLNRLGRLARCLERAAEARDEEASVTILEDLRRAAQQYEKALTECFHSFAGVGG